MFEVRSMNNDDAQLLEGMMRNEDEDYLRFFSAFDAPNELARQLSSSVRDQFFVLRNGSTIEGFFCLRGLDAGFSRPSFGVYIPSRFKGQGLAKLALESSVEWCRQHGVENLMLKVADANSQARCIYTAQGFQSIGKCDDTGHVIMERGIN